VPPSLYGTQGFSDGARRLSPYFDAFESYKDETKDGMPSIATKLLPSTISSGIVMQAKP
jgi:hypothetical protein